MSNEIQALQQELAALKKQIDGSAAAEGSRIIRRRQRDIGDEPEYDYYCMGNLLWDKDFNPTIHKRARQIVYPAGTTVKMTEREAAPHIANGTLRPLDQAKTPARVITDGNTGFKAAGGDESDKTAADDDEGKKAKTTGVTAPKPPKG